MNDNINNKDLVVEAPAASTLALTKEMLQKLDGIDLIITDVNMPTLNGYSASLIATTMLDCGIPIIALTGLQSWEVPKDVFRFILQKPTSITNLKEAIKKCKDN